MDLGLEDLLATTNAEISKKSTSAEDKKEGDSSPISGQSKQGNMDTDYGGVGNAIVTAAIDEAQINDSGENPQEERSMLPQISPMKREFGNRPMTTAMMKTSPSSEMHFTPNNNSQGTRRPQTSVSAPFLGGHGNSTEEFMTPSKAHKLPQFEDAKDLVQNKEKFAKWLRREGVKAAAVRLGLTIKEMKFKSLDSFRREPNRPFDVPPHIQMTRFKHHEQRRVSKVALVIADMEQERARAMGESRSKKKTAFNDEDLRKTFSNTIVAERRRLKYIDKMRTKAWGVLMNENNVLHGIRQRYSNKLSLAEKREVVLRRRKAMQQEQAARQAQQKAAYCKKVRLQADQRFNDKLEQARVEVEKKAAVAEERRRRVEEEKSRLVVDQTLVEKRREDIKQRVKHAMDEKGRRAEEKRRAADRRNRIRAEERRQKFEADRERRALKARDQAEQVRMQRNAMLASQAAAQDERYAWKKRMGLLDELKDAIRHERQMDQKRRRKMEWERKQQTIFLRDQLPGPGEYNVPTTIGKGIGAAKWGTTNPKSDVEWAIYYAKDLPGPGQYDVKEPSSAPCARFSQFTPKSDVDWMIYRARSIPGPGQYEPAQVKTRASVTFSKFTPKGEIDKIVEKSREQPGPGDYSDTDLRPIKRRSLVELKTLLGADVDVGEFATNSKNQQMKLETEA